MNLRQQLQSTSRIYVLPTGLLEFGWLQDQLYTLCRTREDIETIKGKHNHAPVIDVMASGETYVRLDYAIRHHFATRFGPGSVEQYGKPEEGGMDGTAFGAMKLEWTKFHLPEIGRTMALMTSPDLAVPSHELWMIDWSDLWPIFDIAIHYPAKHLVITNVQRLDYR